MSLQRHLLSSSAQFSAKSFKLLLVPLSAVKPYSVTSCSKQYRITPLGNIHFQKVVLTIGGVQRIFVHIVFFRRLIVGTYRLVLQKEKIKTKSAKMCFPFRIIFYSKALVTFKVSRMSTTQCKKHSYKIVRLLVALQRSHFLLCRSQRAVFKGVLKAVCLFSDRYCGLGRDPHFPRLPEVSL